MMPNFGKSTLRLGVDTDRLAVTADIRAPDPDQLIRDAQGLDFRPLGELYSGVRALVRPSHFRGEDRVLAAIMRKVSMSAGVSVSQLIVLNPGDLREGFQAGLRQQIPLH